LYLQGYGTSNVCAGPDVGPGSPPSRIKDRTPVAAALQRSTSLAFRPPSIHPGRKVPLGDALIVAAHKRRGRGLGQGEEFLRRFQLTCQSAVWINHDSPASPDNSTAPAARKGEVKAGETEFCEKTNLSDSIVRYRPHFYIDVIARPGPQPWDCRAGLGSLGGLQATPVGTRLRAILLDPVADALVAVGGTNDNLVLGRNATYAPCSISPN
jgi:hypothetical protein